MPWSKAWPSRRSRRWLLILGQSARKEYDDEIQRERDLTMTSLAGVQRRTRPNDITESSRATTRKIVSAANIVLFAASLFGVEIGFPRSSHHDEFHGNLYAAG